MTNSKLIILLKSIYYGLETVIERIKNKVDIFWETFFSEAGANYSFADLT